MKEMEHWEETLEALRTEMPEGGADTASEAAFEKRLEKAIDRRIRKICLKTIAVVLVVLAVVFLGISPLMNLLCPDPEKLPGSGRPLTAYLQAYYDTVQPFTEIVVSSQSVEKNGFGRYTVQFQSLDHTGGAVVVRPNAAAEYAYGAYRITREPDDAIAPLTSLLVNRFGTDAAFDKQAAIERLQELPASSRISLSATAAEPVSLASLRQTPLALEWMQIEADSEWCGGIRLYSMVVREDGDWRQEMDDEELRQAYLGNLELLLSEPKLLSGLSFSMPAPDGVGGYVMTGETCVRENYEVVSAQEGPLMTRCFSFSGQRDEVLAYLEQADLQGVHIEEVELI